MAVCSRTRWAYLPGLLAAGVFMAGCSGSSPGTPPGAQARSGTPAAPAAAPGATPTECADACGKVEPVLLNVSSDNGSFWWTGIRPATINLSVDELDSDVVYDLSWSSWPSGPGGVVPARSTARAAGKVKVSSTTEPVTITLSDPGNGDPSLWQTLTEQIRGQQPAVYHYGGVWADSVTGGQELP
jgi:hypothetical protein